MRLGRSAEGYNGKQRQPRELLSVQVCDLSHWLIWLLFALELHSGALAGVDADRSAVAVRAGVDVGWIWRIEDLESPFAITQNGRQNEQGKKGKQHERVLERWRRQLILYKRPPSFHMAVDFWHQFAVETIAAACGRKGAAGQA